MPRFYPLEMIMHRKSFILVVVLILSILALSACNLPERQISQAADTNINQPLSSRSLPHPCFPV